MKNIYGLTFIFDLDGTLVDSFDQIIRCASKVRSEFGMAGKSTQELEMLIGLPAEEMFKDDSPSKVEEAVASFRRELFKEIKWNNVTYDGVVELIEYLRKRNILIAVATSKPHQLAKLVVENSSLNGLIDHVQGLDGFPPKPNPEVVKRCQKKLPSDRFVMIGDRPEDILAGSVTGCYCVGIAQGVFGERELKKSGAQETFQTIEQFLMSIDEFLSRLDFHEQ